jgi:hypothetical protein
MLGVTRPMVSEVARELQAAGAIDYARGRVTILTRPEVEARSCEYCGVIRRIPSRLYQYAPRVGSPVRAREVVVVKARLAPRLHLYGRIGAEGRMATAAHTT